MVMIAAGVVFLLRELSILDFAILSNWIWTVVFGVLSLFFF